MPKESQPLIHKSSPKPKPARELIRERTAHSKPERKRSEPNANELGCETHREPTHEHSHPDTTRRSVNPEPLGGQKEVRHSFGERRIDVPVNTFKKGDQTRLKRT
jgi:hypothetical protein